jgi:hypothetical protein
MSYSKRSSGKNSRPGRPADKLIPSTKRCVLRFIVTRLSPPHLDCSVASCSIPVNWVHFCVLRIPRRATARSVLPNVPITDENAATKDLAHATADNLPPRAASLAQSATRFAGNRWFGRHRAPCAWCRLGGGPYRQPLRSVRSRDHARNHARSEATSVLRVASTGGRSLRIRL